MQVKIKKSNQKKHLFRSVPLGNSLGSNGAHSPTDDGRTCEGGMDLETREEHAHTRDESACHPLDRSATLLRMHGAREEFAISVAALGNGDACMENLLTACVCCSCAALCAVACMGSSVYACACSTHAP